MSRLLRGAAVAGAAAIVAALGFAGAASAHVSVSASDPAIQGGFTRVAFRVPNETENTDTTKVEVHLPPDHPVASVSVMPVPGWTVDAQKTKLATPLKSDDGEVTDAVTVITWTATADAAIKPGQFQEFAVSLGPLPETDKLIFKALQTYSDGNIVRWIEEPGSDGKEPEHPAPTLILAKAGGAENPASSKTATGTPSSSKDSGPDSTAIG
ncbi:MAG: hypothetical protein QOI74_471, partial [Micromonosporaceae bacterium]|nr:hypothetical protein [Micromonosporaceae bacterium]